MAAEQGRSLAETPTWSVATVTTLMVAACFLVERSLSRFAKVTTRAIFSPSLLLSFAAVRLAADPAGCCSLRTAVAAQDQAEGHARRAREDPRRYARSLPRRLAPSSVLACSIARLVPEANLDALLFCLLNFWTR
jgi:hypothetical protein